VNNIGKIALALTLACTWLAPSGAAAQDYPTRPVKIIVPFPPGGGVDTVARLVGQEMAKSLGQPFVVENRPGAAGTIGAAAAARSDADGYTLVMLPGGHPLYGATYKSLPFDTVNSFDWISTIVTLQFLVVVPGDSKYKSMTELVADAKAEPDKITFASAGASSTHHLTVEMIGSRVGAKFLHVPYQGDAGAANALLAKQVQFTMATPTLMVGNVEAGKARVLAVTGNTRWPGMPNVPTVEEALGIKDFDVRTWFGLAGPAGIPRPIVEKLNAELRKALTVSEVRDRLEKIGGEVRPSTPAEFRDRVARELAMWIKIVDEAKLPKQ
jgi:tripartite-type tricarboxylate transporter receptor subunit TctC